MESAAIDGDRREGSFFSRTALNPRVPPRPALPRIHACNAALASLYSRKKGALRQYKNLGGAYTIVCMLFKILRLVAMKHHPPIHTRLITNIPLSIQSDLCVVMARLIVMG